MDYFDRLAALRTRLAALDRRQWPLIAESVGITRNLPAKIVYEPKREFRPSSIAPLLAFFDAVDAGERQLPDVAGQAVAPRSRKKVAVDSAAIVDKRAGSDRREADVPIAFVNRRKGPRRDSDRDGAHA